MDVHPGHGDASDDDVRYLERLGYKQQLSRVAHAVFTERRLAVGTVQERAVLQHLAASRTHRG